MTLIIKRRRDGELGFNFKFLWVVSLWHPIVNKEIKSFYEKDRAIEYALKINELVDCKIVINES